MQCKWLTPIVLLSLLAACLGGPAPAGKADTPEALLRQILACAQRRDYQGVRALVYPSPGDTDDVRGVTAQDYVVAGMKLDRGLDYTGDFSYSQAALERILERHLDQFHPITDKDSFWLRPTSQGWMADERVQHLAGRDPSRFHLFDYKDCHILLVELEEGFRLLFWEGMNFLLRDQ